MRRLIPTLPALVLICGAWVCAAGAADTTQTFDVLAHGSGESLWTARVFSADDGGGALETIIHARFSGAADLRPMARLSAAAVKMTHRGSQLVVLLGDGQWRLIWPGGSATGTPLPGESTKLLALAGQGNRLWAVALVPGGISTLATQPSTLPATSPTTDAAVEATTSPSSPATRPGKHLVLFRLEGGEPWQAYAELPDELLTESSHRIAMDVASMEQPAIAVAEDDRVRVMRLTRERQWKDLGRVSFEGTLSDFDWVHGMPRPTLWVAGPAGPGRLMVKEDRGWRAVELEATDPISAGEHRAIAVALDRIRLVYTHQGKIIEQRYELDGTPLDDASELSLGVPAKDMRYLHWMNLAAMVALMLAMLGSMRRRRAMSTEQILRTTAALAPVGARVAAGVVDALPALVGVFLLRRQDWSDLAAAGEMTVRDLLPLWIGIGVYLLHTTLTEMIWGRSLGKKLFGLRVVSMDGQRAGPVAVLLRNFLRLAEMPIAPVVFIMMLYSPMRQRAGDIAAATIVVSDEPKPAKETED